jgi:hypothetical protein
MENRGLLFIPDISGFSRFVNEVEIEHSRFIIQQLLARIIHQPKKLTEEGALGARMMRKTAVSQEHRHPTISASGCPGTVPTGLMVVIGHNASSQPPQAYSKLLAPEPSTLSTELPRAC